MNLTAETEIRAQIRAFILASVPLPELADDDNLFASGIVNSLFAVELMTFLEKTFGIEVTSDDLDIANFQTIEACVRFVTGKQNQTSAA